MLLTDDQMTEVFGGACYSTVCDDCTHGCRFIAEAQLKKVVEIMKEKQAYTTGRNEVPFFNKRDWEEMWQSMLEEVK